MEWSTHKLTKIILKIVKNNFFNSKSTLEPSFIKLLWEIQGVTIHIRRPQKRPILILETNEKLEVSCGPFAEQL